jgi:hypothetical protein
MGSFDSSPFHIRKPTPHLPSKDRGRVWQVSRQPPIRVYLSAFRAMPAFFVAIPPLPLNCGEMRSAGGTLWVGGGSQERRGWCERTK